MTLDHAFIFSMACGALCLLPPRPGLAAERACRFVSVEVDAAALGLAPDLPEQIRSALAQRDGIDTCARVRLARAQPGIRVEVSLPDGRSAARSVTRTEDVVPVLEALLLVPRHDAALAAPPVPASPPPPPSSGDAPASTQASAQAAPPRPPKPAERGTPSSTPEPSVPGWGLELSVVGSARVGDNRTSAGLGVLSLLNLWGWLAGFEGRANSYGGTAGEPQAALQLGALGGRRFHFENVALDLLAGPALALQGHFETETTGPAGTISETSSPVEARLLLASHLSFAARSALRGFVGVEGEIGLAGSPGPDVRGDPSAPARLPAWMLGLALGATVGTR